MSTNPFRKHASSLFASRGCDIDQALVYAHEVMGALANEQDKTPMLTAIMVIINTAANAFDQARGPSPERLAILQLIHNEISNWASSNFDDHIDGWVDDNLHDKLDSWMNNNMDFDSTVSDWMDNNLESKLGDGINEWMNEYLESHISDAIDNLDLVVRTR